MNILRSISFTIPIAPQSVQFGSRANFRTRRFYTDKDKAAYTARIIEESKHHAPDQPHNGMVLIRMDFYLPKASWVKCDERDEPRAWGILGGHPDDDNLYKGTKDALTKAGFWIDDGQIVGSQLRKFWAAEALFPRIEVQIDLLELEAGNIPPAALPKKPRRTPQS